MNDSRDAAAVLSRAGSTAWERSLLVMRAAGFNLVGSMRVHDLGFSASDAVTQSRVFARRLLAVSRQVALQQEAACQAAGNAPTAEQLDDALTLAPPVRDALLRELRAVGAPMRANCSAELVQRFQYHDFLVESTSAEAPEPALVFQEDEREPPILWEMMYDGGLSGAVDWTRFWGLRVPVTHWIYLSRTPEIRLRGGLFAGTTDDLRFAGREFGLLGDRLRHVLLRRSIEDYFRSYVRDELLAQAMTPEVADAWLAARGDSWLHGYLAGQSAPGPNDPDEWKQEKIVAMFTGADFQYDLLHFACHCTPSDSTEFLTELRMRVGGEPVSLNVGLIKTDLGQPPTSAAARGPLVFLNACGTGQVADVYQPPGFPSAWIRHRGALAVLATICPVPDYFAHAFASKFYEVLFPATAAALAAPRSLSLAAALLATRRHFMERHGNPLGLAYVLYAERDAHVVVGLEAGAAV